MTTLFVVIALIFLFRFLKPFILPLLFIGFRVLLFVVIIIAVLAFIF